MAAAAAAAAAAVVVVVAVVVAAAVQVQCTVPTRCSDQWRMSSRRPWVQQHHHHSKTAAAARKACVDKILARFFRRNPR